MVSQFETEEDDDVIQKVFVWLVGWKKVGGAIGIVVVLLLAHSFVRLLVSSLLLLRLLVRFIHARSQCRLCAAVAADSARKK